MVTVGATVEFGTTVLVRKPRPLLDPAAWLRLNFGCGGPSTSNGCRSSRSNRAGDWWSNALRSVPGRQRPVLRQIIEVSQVRGMVHAALDGYGVVTDFLVHTDVTEFGDAITGTRP